MLFLIAKTTAAAFNSLTFNSTPTAENIDCNNFVITVTCCRATLVVSWPEAALPHNISSCLSRCLVEHRTSHNCRTTTYVVAWRLVVPWPSSLAGIPLSLDRSR